MKTKISNQLILFIIAFSGLTSVIKNAAAQDYVSPTKPFLRGRSPGVKVKLISNSGTSKTYVLIFAPGDEVMSGLSEFADKYQVKSAHFTAIGDVQTGKVGWYDKSRKMFKVIPISTPSEITSLIGDIALYNDKPAVHAHINIAAEDGTIRGGHLLEAFISPTLEVMMTVEPEPLYKKLNSDMGLALIDPDLSQ
jgi:predicted DNA-binding protein with PD1-like motif